MALKEDIRALATKARPALDRGGGVVSHDRPSTLMSTGEQLAWFFHRNGYIRWLDPERRDKEAGLYKKGDEVRLVAKSTDELRKIRRLLHQAGLRAGTPFRKGRQWRQPVYGRGAVARFLTLIGEGALARRAKE
jgi:hypothetical protein